ncbi:MAG: prepilin-type N-terminal cleavage/methylation domain-containing protein [Patescibacteria group bacterium]|nr:prepilin-type N-terminal cleavage/methylation domain-containing protein [Patescibacteria group bacterium]
MERRILKAFSLIEILVSLFIIMVLVLSIYPLINFSLQITSDNKNQIQAINIANEKLEKIRALSYDDIGTINGVVPGILEDGEVVIRNGTFNVSTTVMFFDDDYDGLLSEENDNFIDYKKATVRVAWQTRVGEKQVIMSSFFIPPTSQDIPEGWGLLKIHVIDSNGNPVNNANVTINNSDPNFDFPIINANYSTFDSNILSIPVKPSNYYKVSVSKNGYTIDRTYSQTEMAPSMPVKHDLVVNLGKKTESDFIIDQVSKFNIRTVRATLPDNKLVNFSSINEQSPAVDSDGTYSYFVWQNLTTNKIYLQKFDPDGNSQLLMGDDLEVVFPGAFPDIQVIKDSNLAMCFKKELTGYANIFVSFFDSSFSDPVNYVLSGPSVADSTITNQSNCKMAYSYSASTTIVVWDDDRDFSDFLQDVYIKIYNEDFSTRVISRVNVDRLFNQSKPDVNIDSSGYIYVVWTDNRSGDEDIYIQKLNSDGVNLWSSDKRVNSETGGNQNSPSIAVDKNDNIYVVWTDGRSGDDGIYIQKLNSDGDRLWSSDKRVNVETYSNQHSPKISIDEDNNIYVVWIDNRNINNNSNEDIYIQKLDSGGLKYSRDYRVNTNNDPSSQNSADISMNGNYPIIVWSDNRNDNHDIYFSKFIEYNNPTLVPNINVAIQGTKQIGSNPNIFKYDTTINSGSSGYINNYEIDADGSGYTINANNVLMIDPSSPIKIGPGEVRDIMIYLE